ncbi:ribonuclease D [Roseibacillus ishigakijimensis]|uniref:Ribonuclease D n=1 Tax=Roseibacillus ishigakijimensis TaxID=454146 RepID=A0A934RPZ0_9BACT|nr:ribonuclease D [Roseibacillus ishigakijimensis]MBK1834835.1 ribonuclease D [Roseibacillus ishigakijimensis]
MSEPVVWGYDEALLESELLGLDLEADSLFRYSERICLIQLTDGERGVLVDPLDADISELANRLLSRPLWLHGADYDMALMRQGWGGVPPEVWDTQIGARLIGCRRFGYANLVEEFFGVTLPKGSQKADWGQRPLPDKMAQYALNDVKYLIPMARKIVARLRELGRYEWFVESCQWDRQRALERPTSREDAWRIKGSGKLDRKTLAYLKELWTWREKEAEAWNRPSFMVAGNKDLLAWSLAGASGERLSLGRMRSDRRRRLLEVVAKVAEIDESDFPEKIKGPRRVRDREREKRVEDLLQRREKRAAELDLDPSVLGARASLEAFAAGDDSKLMEWQKRVLDLTL